MEEYSVAEIERRSNNFISGIVKDCVIVVDTSSFLLEASYLFWEHITSMLKECKSHVFIPRYVYDEIEKCSNDPECFIRNKALPKNAFRLAQTALTRIRQLISDELAIILPDDVGNTPDSFFILSFLGMRLRVIF